MKVPNGRRPGDGSAQARRHGGIRRQLPEIFFCVPQILLCSENLFQRFEKYKHLFPMEMHFAPTILKTWLRAWFCQNCPQLGCFEVHSASRCRITLTFFYKSPLEGSSKHFGGGQSWADTALVNMSKIHLANVQNTVFLIFFFISRYSLNIRHWCCGVGLISFTIVNP